MDEQTKKKVLGGVLGVLVLGMGTYYFVLRDSGPEKKSEGPVASARREKAANEARGKRETDRRERPKEEAVEEDDGSTRRVREESEDEASGRRRRGAEEGKVKKKEMKPAA